MQMKKRIFLTLALLASVGSAVAQTPASSPALNDVVQKARKEGKLIILLQHPTAPANRKKVIDAFKKRFDLDINIDWAPMHPTTLMSRLAAEGPSGRFSGDVGAGSLDDIYPAFQKGYVDRVNWVELFGAQMPALNEAVGDAPGEMQNAVLPLFDLVYGLVWNTAMIKDADLPKRFVDLADPKWKGKLALNSFHLAPVDYLNYAIGPEKTIDFAGKLLANNPVLKPGSGAVGSAVSSGEAPVGTGMAYATSLAVRRGEPVKFRAFQDYTPVLGFKIFVPKFAPNPNAARLFTAWYVSEGMKLIAEDEFLGRLKDPESVVGRQLAEEIKRQSSTIVSVRSVSQFEQLVQTRTPIDKLVSGQKAR